MQNAELTCAVTHLTFIEKDKTAEDETAGQGVYSNALGRALGRKDKDNTHHHLTNYLSFPVAGASRTKSNESTGSVGAIAGGPPSKKVRHSTKEISPYALPQQAPAQHQSLVSGETFSLQKHSNSRKPAQNRGVDSLDRAYHKKRVATAVRHVVWPICKHVFSNKKMGAGSLIFDKVCDALKLGHNIENPSLRLRFQEEVWNSGLMKEVKEAMRTKKHNTKNTLRKATLGMWTCCASVVARKKELLSPPPPSSLLAFLKKRESENGTPIGLDTILSGPFTILDDDDVEFEEKEDAQTGGGGSQPKE